VVLFDLGSTLLYFDGDWRDVFTRSRSQLVQALESAGFAIDAQIFPQVFGERLDAYRNERESEFIEHTTLFILRSLLEENGFSGVNEAVLRPALKAMYAVSQEHWRVEEETLPTLNALKESGRRLGLISNAADDADVQTLVDRAGIRGYFDTILTSARVGRRKPHPLLFRTALDHWPARPDQAVMVGDTLGADILGAQEMGMANVWVTRRADRIDNRSHEGTIQPDAVIPTLSELPALLENWEQNPPRASH